MPEIPDCLARRYKALDELIRELTSDKVENSNMDCSSKDPGVKLMCDFWNILKENPDCDLTHEVEQRMGLSSSSKSTGFFHPKRVTCYMAGCCNRGGDANKDPNKQKRFSADTRSCQRSNSPSTTSDSLPLSKVLCNLKEAASFEKKCQGKVNDLLATQKELQDQITHLEQREKEGIQMLKQADCMWSCMEQSYKKKVAESLERQKTLLKQLKEVEESTEKWRKNKKDLEFQMDNITKCHQEIKEKITEKNGDLKCIDLEISDFKKRIENNKSDIEVTKKSFSSKRNASDAKIAYIANEVSRIEKQLNDERKRKSDKEKEGNTYIKEAREDLQKLCKVLLQKKLENEDMKAEKEALLLEIEMLKQTCDQCRDKCKNKQQAIEDEIKSIDNEIANFKVRCIRCHECTDTVDFRKLCTDCPRCAEERHCLLEGDHCSPDQTMDCVCTVVKQKFLDNVFDNMYTVLERQTKTGPGKAVADAVLNCLKNSRNGKLNAETRKILQDFILCTVKKNLNLTIVGGAVKTRCELDPDTYKQLMLCLKQIKATKAPKVDKGTLSRKEPCHRWGSTSECNCPRGPKNCICTSKAPPPPNDPTPCPQDPDDMKPDSGEVVMCPHKDSTPCGPDCAMHAPDRVATEVAAWKPSPCQAPSCQFKNMRAAQCVLGPEALSTVSESRAYRSVIPLIPSMQDCDKQANCQCGSLSKRPCDCHKDTKQLNADCMTKFDKDTSTNRYDKYGEKKCCRNNMRHEIKTETKYKEEKSKSNVATETRRYESRLVTKDDQRMSSNLEIIFEKEESSQSFNNYLRTLSRQYGTDSRESISKDSSGNSVKVTCSECDEQIHDDVPKISRSTSGNIIMGLDGNLIKFIEEKTKENPNFFATLKQDRSGLYYLDFSCTEADTCSKKLKVKRTLSGSLLMEVIKKDRNKSSLKKSNDEKTIPSSKLMQQEQDPKQLRRTMPNLFLDKCINNLMDNKKDTLAHTDGDQCDAQLCKAVLKGLLVDIKEPVILRRTQSGNYDIVMNKEFENQYKNTIKQYNGEEKDSCVRFCKANPQQYIISFDRSEKGDHKDAYLIKSESGNLKLITCCELDPKYRKKGSIVSANILENIFNCRLKNRTELNKQKLQSILIKEKSCSDSNIYNRFKIDSLKQLGIESPLKLQQTSSGLFTIVMDKESRKNFAKNLKSYLSDSSKGVVPIKKDENGEIVIVLNGELNNEVEYGSLTISPSGNIYINLTDTSTKKSIDASTDFTSHNELKWEQFIDEIQNPIVKAIATTCNAKEYSSCDINKCVCKNIQYKSKTWFINDNDVKDSFNNKERNNKDLKVSLGKLHDNNKPRHIVIKPCNKEREFDDRRCPVDEAVHQYTDRFCHEHANRYNNLSNELLEISSLCNHSIRETTPNKQQSDGISTSFRIKPVEKQVKSQRQKEIYDWDSIEFLPHQLPPFLKDFM
ncbi:uncharacterized protein LOC123696925 isoform X1 [Colias croceus]|uniref:uncharacterized protein LOC123696925 isoform X1 n=1 Tax=Colias crocea TaxID=72248 RepID=UPI001E28041E|nr:uncharacterized protein LOC123696925 isoform X1 [Colias croceus]XP_045499274.1 uncharacterized protein LOC123696925 isoform X1 [Colias croceus]